MLRLSYAISGTFDCVFKVADVAGVQSTDKLNIGDYVKNEEFDIQ